MRSRSTCDGGYAGLALMSLSFQSQMRSRSTCDPMYYTPTGLLLSCVSISDEKPLHMRRLAFPVNSTCLAMFQSQMRSRSTFDNQAPGDNLGRMYVSISDEKPLHMRPGV